MLRSFRTTLVLIILVSSGLPVCLFSLLYINKVYTITHDAAFRELELTAKGVSDSLEHETNRIKTRLLSLGSNRDMALATRKSALGVRHYLSEQASDSIKAFILDNPLVSSLYLIDTDLETALAAPVSVMPVSPAPVLKHAEEQFLNKPDNIIPKYRVVGFKDNEFFTKTNQAISDGDHLAQKLKSPWGMAILVPVVLDVTDEVKGVLAAIIPFQNLAASAFSMVGKHTTLEFYRNDAIIFPDREEKSVARPDTISAQVLFEIRNPQNEENIRYGIKILEPSHIRFAEVSRTVKRLILYIFGALVLLIGVAYVFARLLTTPLKGLINTVNAYADGNYDFEPPQVRFSEFQTVVLVLGEMGKRILSQITELRKAEEKYRGIFENATEGIFQTTDGGQVLTVNPAMAQIFGYDSSEDFLHHVTEIGKQLYVESSRLDEFRDLMKKNGIVRDFEYKAYRKDGTIIDVSKNSHAVKDKNQNILYFEGTLTDVTEKNRIEEELRRHRDHLEELVDERTSELEQAQEQLAEAEARSRLILESAGDGIFGVDMNGNITFVNPAASHMIGFTLEEFAGQNLHALIHHSRPDGSPYPKEACPMYDSFTNGTVNVVDDEVLWRKGGRPFPVEYASTPIRKQDRLVGAVVTFRDITERKRAKAELIQAKRVADEASKAKGDFLANMSHEIRTPMNAVIGMAHLALQTDLSPKQEDYLKKIQRSAHALLGIINDILDFSKIEAGKLQMESADFSLEEVLDNVSTVVGVKVHEKELEFLMDMAPDVPMALVGDPLRLGQVLINLCNNAVKFTQEGEIVISTQVLEKGQKSVTLQFCVRDTGVGLTEEQKVRLFQAFSQADTSTTRKYGGTGLGLTISKRLVNMMEGEIWVESEPGKGSEFIFTAKFGLARKVSRRHLEPSVDLRGMRVLVVDDNASSREILQTLLESMSFQVTLAASAEEGIAELEKEANTRPYQLVVMDWRMPGMDGIKASAVIKRHPSLPRKPKIIIATAYGREEVMQRSEKVGVDGFLLKPVGQSVLFDAIMVAFGKEAPEGEAEDRVSAIDGGKLQRIRGARVLLAEDNEINQQVAKEILEQAGLVVSIANNGKEALEIVRAGNFEAVLMDIQMPVMGGFEATREIRKDGRFKDLPIIAMTAHAMAGDREKSLEAGMNDHVTKPIDPDQLFSAMVKWIKPGNREVSEGLGESLIGKNEAEDILPSELPGISIDSGLGRVGGNKQLYGKLLCKFKDGQEKAPEQIKAALNAGDVDIAARLAHTVKGVSGNLGGESLYRAADDLEKAIKEGKESLDHPMKEFGSQLKVVMDGIKIFEESLTARQVPEKPALEVPIDKEAVKPLLQEMAQLLESDLTEAMNRFEALKQHLINSSVCEEFKRLEKHVEGFDTDSALKSVEAIAGTLDIEL